MAPTTGVGIPLGKASRAGQEITDKVGPTLRARREQLGWSLDDVAAWLRIRLNYLQALEEGSTRNMPGDAYVVGFLRTYASALGFEPEDMVARFKRETGGLARKPELTFPAPAPDRNLPTGVLILLGIVVIAVAYAAWYRYSDHTHMAPQRVPPMSEVMPGVTGRSTTSPQLATVMPPPGHAPSTLPPVAPAPQTQPAPAATAAPAQQPAPDDFSGGTTTLAPAQIPAPTPSQGSTVSPAVAPTAEAPAQPTPATAPPAPPPNVPADQIALHASAATWVQIKGMDGHVLYDHIMQAGDTWPAPDQGGPFTLTVGNAGGMTVSVGTVTSPVLGKAGAVRRNIPLNPATIRDGSIATVPPVAVHSVPRPAPVAPVAPPVDQTAAPTQ